MLETKHGYVVNFDRMPQNIITFGRFTFEQEYDNNGNENAQSYWLGDDGYEWNDDDIFDNYEDALKAAQPQIAERLAERLQELNYVQCEIADLKAIVLTDPRTTSGEVK
jgi:hypothetical protein